MVSQKAGGAMLGSTIFVMAWTGVYFSRHPRSVEETSVPIHNSSLEVYEIINGSDYFNFSSSVDDNDKRNKIKEVNFYFNYFNFRCSYISNFRNLNEFYFSKLLFNLFLIQCDK